MGPRAKRAYIESLQTPSGGYDAVTLKGFGLSWPPPKGWIDQLVTQDDDYSTRDTDKLPERDHLSDAAVDIVRNNIQEEQPNGRQIFIRMYAGALILQSTQYEAAVDPDNTQEPSTVEYTCRAIGLTIQSAFRSGIPEETIRALVEGFEKLEIESDESQPVGFNLTMQVSEELREGAQAGLEMGLAFMKAQGQPRGEVSPKVDAGEQPT